jgi:cob(I)alamin adenosyltransferase
MTKRTRIYTRTGDDGTTGLVGGGRIAKHALRIACYGTVDELSSSNGAARAALPHDDARATRLSGWLVWTQHVLFNLGSALATPEPYGKAAVPAVGADDVAALERAIDEASDELPPLAAFVLPGGSAAGAALHVARTVCRRAERLLSQLRDEREPVPEYGVQWLNRLSDALFEWARWIDAESGADDRTWKKDAAPPPPLPKR